MLPEENANNDRAVAYLRGRGIDRDILHYCIRAGILYESRAYHNCVFVGHDEQGTARFACVRRTWGDFRLDIESSQKRYSFHLSAAMEEARDLLVAEAPIDILSLATLHKLEGRPWRDQHYLSLGGVAPVALRYYLYRHQSIDRVQLCLDSDEAGRKALCNITDALFRDPELAGRKLTVSAQPPPLGKDWNDTLRAVAQEKTEQQKLGRSSNRAALSI